MATNKSINTPAGQTVARELMIAYLNTGDSSAKKWSAFGKRVASSNMSYDWGKNTERDILGNVFTKLKKPTITQSFDPLPIDSGDEAVVKLWELGIRDQDNQALANQEVMVAHFYSGDSSKNFAEVYDASAIAVSRIALSEATARAVQRIPDAHCNGDMHKALEYAGRVKHAQKELLMGLGIHALHDDD